MQESLALALELELDHEPPHELELEELLELPQPELELEELLELEEPPHELLELELEEEPPQRSSTSRGALKLGWLARFLQELA